MRIFLFLTTLLAFTALRAQDVAAATIPTTNAQDVLNMPSNWAKLKGDKKTRFLFGAVERGDVALAQAMLPDVQLPFYQFNAEGETLLTLAIREGQYEMVKWLMEDAVVNLKNEAGETPLTLAIKKGNAGITALVLERAHADLPNDSDESPLGLAVSYGYEPAFVRQLADRGANPNRLSNGTTPLYRAVDAENVAMAAMLVRVGADPAVANKNGTIPLFKAVSASNAVLAGVLLHRSSDATADANWRTPNGETLVNMAVAAGNTPLLRVLLEKGADANANDYLENTPLHLAAQRGMGEAVELLLAHGALVNSVNVLGATPILLAAGNGHTAIAETLAQAGADPDLRDYAGAAANQFGDFTYSDPTIQQEVTFLLMESER